MSRNERFCILLVKCVGKKKEKGLLKSSTSKVDVLPGTLLLLLDVYQPSTTSPREFILETLEIDCVELRCDDSQFREISYIQFDLLQTISTCGDRLAIFHDKEWLKEGEEIKVGDEVEVYLKDKAKDVLGVLRFKDRVHDLGGIRFGVELKYNPGLGTSDGIFRKHRYFQCAPESAVFVGLHRIRKYKAQTTRHPVQGGATAAPVGAYGPHGKYEEMQGLPVGTRIVWMSDSGPEPGVVKWIGILPDAGCSEDITVGVEFDNPVGSGTGKYKDMRLFNAKQGHASLVPIMGLMKEAEFNGGVSDQLISEEIPGDLGALIKANNVGKSPREVIEEQKKLMEEAQQQARYNLPQPSHILPQSSRIQPVNTTQNLRVHAATDLQKDQFGDVVIEPSPSQQQQGGAMAGKVARDTRGINPLYEYSRGKGAFSSRHNSPMRLPSGKKYLPEGLDTEMLTHGHSSGPMSKSRAKPLPEPDPDLEVGSLVEVMSSPPLYGYIKWIGHLPDQKEPKKLIAGLEMEEEISAGTNGTFGKHRLFDCPPKKGFFVPLYKCRKDKRFLDNQQRQDSRLSDTNFGSTETPDLPGTVSPPESLEDLSVVFGKGKGIQGHHNSCYMDATLLAMFYFTTVFDSILHRPKNNHDLPEYEEVKQVLKEGIVNPLRRHHYVRADKMMKLRMLLDKVGKIPGMMSEEKDPEEFLNLLLNEITKADPFLKISAGDNQETQHTYFYQLIMDKDERLVLPTTQQLFELSFLQMGIKLTEVPSCLIIQMPRFGKDYKMYKRILPSLELDITDVLENAPRECIICGDLAMYECKECYQVHGAGLNTIAFCESCKRTSHQHKQRVSHKPRQIHTQPGYREHYTMKKAVSGQPVTIPREKMELFAVICIQTSHYVSFVKCGRGKQARWIFFDSMADRMGEQSGYNIPEVKECPDIPTWLSDACYNDIMKNPEDKTLPEHMRRLICDAYICMYQSPTVMMFK